MVVNANICLRALIWSWLSLQISRTLAGSAVNGDGQSNDYELSNPVTAASELAIPMAEVKKYIAGSCVFLQPPEGKGCYAVTSMGKLVTKTDGENCEEFEVDQSGQTLRSRTTENCLTHTGDGVALEACTSENQLWQESSAPEFCSGSVCLKKTSTKVMLLSVKGECIHYRDLILGGSGGCVGFEYEVSFPDAAFPLRLDSQCLELADDVVTPKECNGNFRQKFVRVAERICTLDGFGFKTVCFEIQGFQPPLAPDSYAAYFKQHTESQKVGVPRADDVKPMDFESFAGNSGESESEGDNYTLRAFGWFGGNRHASTHLNYHQGTASWWYNEVKALQAPRDTYYMANGHTYGYAGIQWASSWLPFLPLETKVLCSIWDPPSCSSNDRHACPDHLRAKVVECGPGVQCSDRFGGEGSGAKTVLSTTLRTGLTYGFMTSIHPIGNDKVRQSCHFHDPSSGWRLLSKIEVAHEGKHQGLHSMGSFLEDWTGRDGNAHRDALYGPSFTSNDGSQPQTFSQTQQVTFNYGKHGTETDHTSHGYQRESQVGMATGGHGYPLVPSGTTFNIPRVGLPNALQSFIESFGGGGNDGGSSGGNDGDDNDGAPSNVNCGGHTASTCANCPQGNGADWCNGDCYWSSGQCLDRNAPSSVNCGQHTASDCASCPQGNGAGWCNGDCHWGNGQCLNRNDAFILSLSAGVVPFKFVTFALTVVMCSALLPAFSL